MINAHNKTRPVGLILKERDLLTEDQVQQVLRRQKAVSGKRLFGEVVVELGFCTEEQVLDALADAYGIPYARINSRLLDPSAAATLPRDFCEKNLALPLFCVDGALAVALAEPSNFFLIEDIAQRTNLEVHIVACPRNDLRAAIEAAFSERREDAAELDHLLAAAKKDVESLQQDVDAAVADIDDNAEDSPVIKLVHHVITGAVRDRASDIHVEPDENSLCVRYRVDGSLVEKMRPAFAMAAPIVARVKIMAGMDISERRMPQDGAIRVSVDGRTIDLRVSSMPNKFGEKVVLRIVDTQNILIGLDKLGMDDAMRERFEEVVLRPHGIILVTGPTGCGKSTTLYSMLSRISNPQVNVCTVEDPIEVNLKGVNQFQVNDRIGLSFSAVLRSLLRQDPDVIMVGEIRDSETGKVAVQAALTGHLVLSTLHTNDAVSAVTRLVNLDIEPFLVAASVEGVLAQRLVRRICPSCESRRPPTPREKQVAERYGFDASETPTSIGCSRCLQTGFRGRLGIYELLVLDDPLRDAVSSGAPLGRLRELALKTGMSRLIQDGIQKTLAGLTTLEEIIQTTGV
ncbi:MAG: Flp pilus assembly complex ATPase component TadA [Phycisphaerales bacterium]|nr:Flp pilus assembly complex ATPase component TadA [Phycisphaerales bacterium]